MALLALLIAAVVGLPLALNAFAYAAKRSAGSDAGSHPGGPILRSVLHEGAAIVSCMAAWPLAPLLVRHRRAPRSPVNGVALLLAGCGPDRGSFWLLAQRLRRRGWLVDQSSPRRWPDDPRASAAAIDGRARAAEARAPGKPVVIVAHAAGGLAARDYLRRHADAPISMLLTLGTAHQEAASPALRLPCLHGPGGTAVRELNRDDPVPDRFDVVAISSDMDVWVVPTAAYYPRAFNICVSTVGHFGLLFSRKVFGLVLENIEAARPPHRRTESTASSTRATSSPSL